MSKSKPKGKAKPKSKPSKAKDSESKDETSETAEVEVKPRIKSSRRMQLDNKVNSRKAEAEAAKKAQDVIDAEKFKKRSDACKRRHRFTKCLPTQSSKSNSKRESSKVKTKKKSTDRENNSIDSDVQSLE